MDHTNGTRVLVRFILVWSEGSWTGEGERENFWNSVRKGRGFDRILKEKEKREDLFLEWKCWIMVVDG